MSKEKRPYGEGLFDRCKATQDPPICIGGWHGRRREPPRALLDYGLHRSSLPLHYTTEGRLCQAPFRSLGRGHKVRRSVALSAPCRTVRPLGRSLLTNLIGRAIIAPLQNRGFVPFCQRLWGRCPFGRTAQKGTRTAILYNLVKWSSRSPSPILPHNVSLCQGSPLFRAKTARVARGFGACARRSARCAPRRGRARPPCGYVGGVSRFRFGRLSFSKVHPPRASSTIFTTN